jgi:hypothetical protein
LRDFFLQPEDLCVGRDAWWNGSGERR